MERKLEDAREEGFIEQVEERYRTLSAEADDALDKLGDLRHMSRPSVADEVDHVEATRELMSSQVVALRRADDDHFQTLRHDVERVSGEFEEAVKHLRTLADNPERKRARGHRGNPPRPSERPHPQPGDVAP